jgi:hypothetical protein
MGLVIGSIGKSMLLFVGAGSLMSIRRHSEQQLSPNSIIHISLRHPNPPILENIGNLAIKTISVYDRMK